MKDRDTLILLYHNIVRFNKKLKLYDVNYHKFNEQMAFLKEFGTFLENYDKGKDLPKSTLDLKVKISFDDGYRSWTREVLSLFRNIDLTAYFFICIEYLQDGGITRKEIRELRDNSMVIGSHSLTHRFFHTLNEEEIYYELRTSKEMLEDILGEKVKYFSAPRGYYDERVVEIAKEVGYERLFSSDIGLSKETDFVFKRIPIRRDTSLDQFKKILSGRIIEKLALKQKVKNSGKKVLGINTYNLIRRLVVRRAE